MNVVGAEGCNSFDEIAAELALGVATGEQRATALAHAAGCERCRRRLDELSGAADGLLLLAPEQEPPVGFESALRARRGGEEDGGTARPRGRSWLPARWPRVVVPALAAVVAIFAAGAVWLGTGDDRRLASDYREALGAVDGSYFTTFAITGPGSERLGSGFGYEGDPSWTFVTLDAPPEALPDGSYRLGLRVTGAPPPEPVPITVTGGHGSGGIALPGELEDFDGLTLTGPGGRIPLQADSTRPIYP